MLCACARAAENTEEIAPVENGSLAQGEANGMLGEKAFIAAAQEAQSPDEITSLLDRVDTISDEALLIYEDSLHRIAKEYAWESMRSHYPAKKFDRRLFKLGLQHPDLLYYGVTLEVDYIALRMTLDNKISCDGMAYLDEQVLNEHNTYTPGNTYGYYTTIAHDMERKSIFENKHPGFMKLVEANGYKHYSHSVYALGCFLLESSGEGDDVPVDNERRQQFIQFLDFEISRLTGGFLDPAINIPCVYGKDVEKAVGLLETNGWMYTNDIRDKIYDIVAANDPENDKLQKPWLEVDERFAQLKAKEGLLPDKDVEAFIEYLESVREAYNAKCPSYGNFIKDPKQNVLDWHYSIPGGGYFVSLHYAYLAEQLQGKASPAFIEEWSNVSYGDC